METIRDLVLVLNRFYWINYVQMYDKILRKRNQIWSICRWYPMWLNQAVLQYGRLFRSILHTWHVWCTLLILNRTHGSSDRHFDTLSHTEGRHREFHTEGRHIREGKLVYQQHDQTNEKKNIKFVDASIDMIKKYKYIYFRYLLNTRYPYDTLIINTKKCKY